MDDVAGGGGVKEDGPRSLAASSTGADEEVLEEVSGRSKLRS